MRKILNMPHRDKVRWKVRLLWLLIILMLAYMVAVGETGGGDSRLLPKKVLTFGNMAFFASLGVVIWRLVHNKRLLNDKLLMKQDAAKNRDERRQYLHDKSGGLVVDVLLVCLLFMAMTAAMYNASAFYVAYAALVLTAALKAGIWLIYNHIE